MTRKTEYLRKQIRLTCGDGPAPHGALLFLCEGTATGNGPSRSGEWIPAAPENGIDISGVCAEEVEYAVVGHLHHEIRMPGRVVPCYWHGIAGGFARVVLGAS